MTPKPKRGLANSLSEVSSSETKDIVPKAPTHAVGQKKRKVSVKSPEQQAQVPAPQVVQSKEATDTEIPVATVAFKEKKKECKSYWENTFQIGLNLFS